MQAGLSQSTYIESIHLCKSEVSLKRAVAGIILAHLAVGVSQTAAQDSAWSRYVPGTLTAIVTSEGPGVQKEIASASGHHSIVSADSRPTEATVVYADSSRPTPAATMELIRGWVKALGIRADAPQLLTTELLFKEGDASFWLPVQSQLIPYMHKEAQAGQQIKILVAWVGAEGTDSTSVNWVFVVNEFSVN